MLMSFQNNDKARLLSSLTLQNFHAFHGMLCSPRVANECIQSFQHGAILFLPSYYEETAVMKEDRYTYNHSLTVVTYYLLVLVSFTGLSSILGQTQTIDAREFNCNDTHTNTSDEQFDTNDCLSSYQQEQRNKEQVVESKQSQESVSCLWSAKGEPNIQIKPFLFDKLKQRHSSVYSNDGDRQGQKISLKLKRRFEYEFSLCNLHVIMLHIESCNTNDAEEENKLLHLVEVYHLRNRLFQTILDSLLYCIGRPVEFIIQVMQQKNKEKNN